MGMRGICNLQVELHYPVSVIAGRNGSGKSTVLFAAACAYRVPGEDKRKFFLSKFFPHYRPRQGVRGDERGKTIIDFGYLTPTGRLNMRWRRTNEQKWNHSFLGRKDARQPERKVYFRTLRNLANLSELPDAPGMPRMKSGPQELNLTAPQIEFAQKLLPFNYSEDIHLFGDRNENLLVATQKSGAVYSELHMAAGERVILRLSQEIAQVKSALVLIDEVEAGLHPFAQKILMQELQRLALDNDLQIIVATHSPVVLDSVPKAGRILLERNEGGEVLLLPPYYDVIQDAFYEKPNKTFNLLCEDVVAEAILEGVFEAIIPRLRTKRNSIRIERNAGASEFAMYARVLKRFDQFQNFILVLDGDQQNRGVKKKIVSAFAGNQPNSGAKKKEDSALAGDKKSRSDKKKKEAKDKQAWDNQAWEKYEARVMFIPGTDSPEEWVWSQMRACSNDLALWLGMDSDEFNRHMDRLDAVSRSATDSASKIAKAKLYKLSKIVGQPGTDICRVVARREAGRKESDIQPLVGDLETAYWKWRGEA